MAGLNLNFGDILSGGANAITNAAGQAPAALSSLLSQFGSTGTAGVTPPGSYNLPPEILEKIMTMGDGKVSPMLQNLGAGASALGGLAQIYTSLKAVNLAAKDFDFQKQAYHDRLLASTKNYNTALFDRATNRGHQYGDSNYASSYYDQHKLTPKGV